MGKIKNMCLSLFIGSMLALLLSFLIGYIAGNNPAFDPIEEVEEKTEIKSPQLVNNLSTDIQKLVDKYEKDIVNLSEQQLAVMMEVANYAHDADMSYTAAAQAWQESNFGLWPVDLADNSCGVYHKIMDFYIKENNLTDTSFNKNKQCSKFLTDIEHATMVYLKDIEYWKDYHKKKGSTGRDIIVNAIKSYNVGRRVDSSYATKYYNSVKARIIVLQRHYDFKVLVANMRQNSYHIANK